MNSGGGKPSGRCGTLYPVMLVHGTNMADRRNPRCWGRIPKSLEAEGACVCFGCQDAWGSLPSNVAQLAESLDAALKCFGADKVNIIAHSKGGLEARALAALPGYKDKIASVTTISTPHRGIKWLTKIWPVARFFIAPAGIAAYPFIRLFRGDKRPNPYRLAKIMTCPECARFNLEHPDQEGIFYQSYAGLTQKGSRAKRFSFSRNAANLFDGDNDGLISVESAKWGLFRGVISGGGKRGISHTDEIDFYKHSFKEKDYLSDGETTYSGIPDVYIRIVEGLKERGL